MLNDVIDDDIIFLIATSSTRQATLLSHYGESKTATTLDSKDYVKQPTISEDVLFEWKTYR